MCKGRGFGRPRRNVSAVQQRQALLMGLPLETAKKWLAARRCDIQPPDRAFIEASVRAERAGPRRVVGVLMLGAIAALLAQMYGEWWSWAVAARTQAPTRLSPQLATDYCIGGLTRKHVSLSQDRVTIGEYALSPTKAAHVSPDPIALSLRPCWA
jgi:hypothetical protein